MVRPVSPVSLAMVPFAVPRTWLRLRKFVGTRLELVLIGVAAYLFCLSYQHADDTYSYE